MRKILVFLFMTGIILGMISVIEEVNEKHMNGEYDPIVCIGEGSNLASTQGQFYLITCNGEGGGGSGGGTPG